MKYTVRVEVIAPDGSIAMTFTTVANKEDLYHPEAVTPGYAKVLAYLTDITA